MKSRPVWIFIFFFFWQDALVISIKLLPYSILWASWTFYQSTKNYQSWGKRALKKATKTASSCSTVGTACSHSTFLLTMSKHTKRIFPEITGIKTSDDVNLFGTSWHVFCIFHLNSQNNGLWGLDSCCLPDVPAQSIPFSCVSTAAHHWPLWGYSSSSFSPAQPHLSWQLLI